MESKKINQLATELSPVLSDLTIIGDPSTGISKKITLSQMASLFTGTVEEYPNLASFPLVGTADTIYIALDTNVLYRWNTGTNAYVELSPNIINSLVFSDANGFDGTISLVGSTATLTITTALTTGSVPFIGASGALTQDNSNLFFDDTNNRLGINTNAPTTALDVFGSGIIGRLNGTSTNNAFLGFANAGTNRWSIGNVQSDHRFRIYSETNTSELLTVLQTGEFGIGIANPTTKFHIDGGASALIANLDANVSVAKSVSFRSDNSNRINLEVSGTESGSNAGANFFLRTYTDLGALIETPFQIVRSTGVTTIKSLTLTNALSVANGGTGSTTQNFVDLTTTQTVGGAKTLSNSLTLGESITIGTGGSYVAGSIYSDSGWGMLFRAKQASPTNAQFRWSNSADTEFMRISPSGGLLVGTTPDGGFKLDIGGTSRFSGAATFSSSISATSATFSDVISITANNSTAYSLNLLGRSADNATTLNFFSNNGATRYGFIYTEPTTMLFGVNGAVRLTIASTGAATFSSTVTANRYIINGTNGNSGQIIQQGDLLGSAATNLLFQSSTGNSIGFLTNGGTTFNMFINTSGNVGIGTSSPVALLNIYGSTHLQLQNATTGSASSDGTRIQLSGNDLQIINRETADIISYTSDTERMRITSAGNVLVGNSTDRGYRFQVNSNDGVFAMEVRQNSGGASAWATSIVHEVDSGTRNMVRFNVGGIGTVGSITSNNTSTSYITSSDYRLKQDFKDYNALNLVSAIKTYDYQWKIDESRMYGLLAHELAEILPYAVNGEKDGEEMQGVDYSKIVPILVKAIQELKEEIDILKNK